QSNSLSRGAVSPYGFDLTRTAQRHREIENLIADVGADVDRRRQRIVVGQLERRAVRKYARKTAQRRFADAQQIALELDLGEPPAVRHEGTTSCLDVALNVALLLLEMLGLQEQPLGPNHPVMRRHSPLIRRDSVPR